MKATSVLSLILVATDSVTGASKYDNGVNQQHVYVRDHVMETTKRMWKRYQEPQFSGHPEQIVVTVVR